MVGEDVSIAHVFDGALLPSLISPIKDQYSKRKNKDRFGDNESRDKNEKFDGRTLVGLRIDG